MAERTSVPFRTSSHFPPLVALLSLLPFISGLTAWYAARNALLITYLAVGMTAFLVLAKFSKNAEDNVYLWAIGCVTLSFFLVTELASPYISGTDILLEFYLFRQVLLTAAWHTTIGLSDTSVYGSLLSTTVLPATISIETSIDGGLIFKFVFPILYCLVPLALYRVYREFLSPSAAFLSVFVFTIDPFFNIGILSAAREMIAEIFLALLLVIAICKRKQSRTRSGALLTLALSLGIITAHYTMAFIFLLLMSASLAMSTFSRRIVRLWGSEILLVWLVLVMGWFLLLTGGTAIADVAANVSFLWVGITRDLLNPATRPQQVQTALFLAPGTGGILHTLSRVIQYVTLAGLALGFLVLIRKQTKTIAERQLIPMMAISMGLLFATVLVPLFGNVLVFGRFLHLALIFISPCFFISGQWIVTKVRRFTSPSVRFRGLDVKVLLSTLVFLYFIFSSGWMWAVTRDPVPTSIAIDWQRMRDSTSLSFVLGYYNWYNVPETVAAAYWLNAHIPSVQPVCADYDSTQNLLSAYSGREPNNPSLAHTIDQGTCMFSSDVVYFSVFNTLYNSYGYVAGPLPLSRVLPYAAVKNRIYSDGAIVYSS